MDRDQEKLRLEKALADYEELARTFPDGPTNGMILDLIEELKQQLRDLEK
jgi:hypothetical protein